MLKYVKSDIYDVYLHYKSLLTTVGYSSNTNQNQMGRVNRNIEGAFVKLMGENDEVPAYESFLNRFELMNAPNLLKKYTKQYKDFIATEKMKLDRICLIEEIILQLRTRETIEGIKLNFLGNNYVYARCPYYRRDTNSKDIRTMVDNIKNLVSPFSNMHLSDNIDDISIKFLESNETFMEYAKNKLKDAMMVVIKKNIKKLNDLEAAIVLREQKEKEKKIEETNKTVVKKAAAKKPAAKKAPAKKPAANKKPVAKKAVKKVEKAEEVLA